MRAVGTAVDGAYVLEASPVADERGASTQLVDAEEFERTVRRSVFPVRQVFHGRSRRGVLRGMHYTRGGSEKIVFCVLGDVHDVLVDVREGSPTFGASVGVRLDGTATRAVYCPPGVAHGYLARANESLLCYLLSNDYVAEREVALDPFDPELALPWPDDLRDGGPVMSSRDRAGLSLAASRSAGLLPSWCGPIDSRAPLANQSPLTTREARR